MSSRRRSSFYEQYKLKQEDKNELKVHPLIRKFFEKNRSSNQGSRFAEFKNVQGGSQEEIVQKYMELADQENSFAQVKLGNLAYEQGNISKAKEYYLRASYNVNSDAFNNIGCIKEKETGSILTAKDDYEKSANLGNPHGLNNLGRYYEFMGFQESNPEEQKNFFDLARRNYEAAQKQQDPDASFNFARMDNDQNKKIDTYEKINCGMALNQVGIFYLKNDQRNKAIEAFSKAKSIYKSSEAIYNLSILMDDQTLLKYLVDQNFTPAFNNYAISIVNENEIERCLRQAIKDPTDYIAKLNYGTLIQKSDPKKAFEYFEIVTKNAPNIHQAWFNLGSCYDHGIGIQPDKKKAIECYEKAIEQSNSKNLRAIRALRLLKTSEDNSYF